MRDLQGGENTNPLIVPDSQTEKSFIANARQEWRRRHSVSPTDNLNYLRFSLKELREREKGGDGAASQELLSRRIREFQKANMELDSRPEGFPILFRADNGRIRMCLEIHEEASLEALKRAGEEVRVWRERLTKFQGPHVLGNRELYENLKRAQKNRTDYSVIAHQLNQLLKNKLCDYVGFGRAKKRTASPALLEATSLLVAMRFTIDKANAICDDAIAELRENQAPDWFKGRLFNGGANKGNKLLEYPIARRRVINLLKDLQK